jgi:hypothetical protein
LYRRANSWHMFMTVPTAIKLLFHLNVFKVKLIFTGLRFFHPRQYQNCWVCLQNFVRSRFPIKCWKSFWCVSFYCAYKVGNIALNVIPRQSSLLGTKIIFKLIAMKQIVIEM